MATTPQNRIAVWEPIIIDRVDEPVDRQEVLRYLGYPAGVAPSSAIESMLDSWLGEAGKLAHPRAVYLVLPVVAKDRRTLQLQTWDRIIEFRGAIGEFLSPAEWVAAFIATAGCGIETLASERMNQGDALAALIINSVGAERAEAAEAAVIAQLRSRVSLFDMAPTLPYSPGYCGMKLTQQKALFELFGAKTVGVSLTDHYLMRPLKSVSGLIGIGPADQVLADGSPCERCELHNCAMRR